MNVLKVTLAAASLVLATTCFAETVHGVLLDSMGKPVSGAVLHAGGWTLQPNGHWDKFSITGRSGPDGSFQLNNAPSKPSAEVPVILVAILPDGHVDNLSLTAENGRLKVTDHWVGLKVHVADAAGKPIRNAKVTVDRVYSVWTNHPKPTLIYSSDMDDFGPRLTQKTNGAGIATIDGLPGGEHAGFKVHEPGMVLFSKNVDLPKDGDISVDAPLTKGVTLTGKVMYSGKPVGGVKVTAWVRGQYMYNGYDTVTGPDGEYRIDDAPAGEMHLNAEPDKRHPDLVAKVIGELKLSEGADLGRLNFVLEKGVRIQGRVRTVASDKPIAGASVLVSPEGGIDSYITTDAKGQFETTVLAGNESVMVTEVQGRRIQDGPNLRVKVDANHNPPLELNVNDILVLPPIPHLTGTTVDSSGNPVSGATVRDLDLYQSVLTDEKGHFEFAAETHPGDRMIAIKGDYASSKEVVLSDDASISLKLDAKTASIVGGVVGDDGKPISGVEMSLGGSGAVGNTATVSDAQGKYRFDGLVCGIGDFYLWSKKAGYGSGTIQPITVVPAENKVLQLLTMSLADGEITGKVLDADLKHAAGVTVSSQMGDVPTVETDANGVFHLTHVPRGKRTLIAGRNHTLGSPTQVRTGDKDVLIVLGKETPVAAGVVQQDLPGKPAPALKIAGWLNGKPIDIQSLKGKIIVVDFWAITCPGCVAALPRMQALSEEYGKQGVVFVGVHEMGTSMAKLKAFVNQKHLTYTIGLDLPEATGLGISACAYQPKGWPTVYVIAPTGRIVAESNEIEDAAKALEGLLPKKK